MTTEIQQRPKRYVYSFDALDRAPEGPTSCSVAPRRLLSGETLATGKSTTVGPVLSGTHVHVAWLLKPRGTGSKLHTHPNEQFNYVVQGTLIADIDGQVLRVPAGRRGMRSTCRPVSCIPRWRVRKGTCCSSSHKARPGRPAHRWHRRRAAFPAGVRPAALGLNCVSS